MCCFFFVFLFETDVDEHRRSFCSTAYQFHNEPSVASSGLRINLSASAYILLHERKFSSRIPSDFPLQSLAKQCWHETASVIRKPASRHHRQHVPPQIQRSPRKLLASRQSETVASRRSFVAQHAVLKSCAERTECRPIFQFASRNFSSRYRYLIVQSFRGNANEQ